MSAVRAAGGKAVYGARIGVLMLDARFPRIPGDMGNATTWPFPVLYRVVDGATPDLVVRRGAEGLLPAFIEAGRELVAWGADGITTNCGFLSIFQEELAQALGVPVAASSLMQAEAIERLLPPGRRVGILTISAATLTDRHLRKAGVPAGTPIIGVDRGRELSRVIFGGEQTLDVAAAEQDVLGAGEALVRQHPEVGAVLLECTNMSPYAAALRQHLGLPVFDIYSFVTWFHQALAPRRFPPPD